MGKVWFQSGWLCIPEVLGVMAASELVGLGLRVARSVSWGVLGLVLIH